MDKQILLCILYFVLTLLHAWQSILHFADNHVGFGFSYLILAIGFDVVASVYLAKLL